jgi:hypothetical protein
MAVAIFDLVKVVNDMRAAVFASRLLSLNSTLIDLRLTVNVRHELGEYSTL